MNLRLAMGSATSALPECGGIDGARIWARLLTGTLFILFFGSFVTPWTQNIPGNGRVIAYSPDDRETPIRATVSGRVEKWHVLEGQSVKKGQLLVELADNDPLRINRLGRARDALGSQRSAVASAIVVAEAQVAALTEARTAALEAAKFKASMARDKRQAFKDKLIASRAKKRAADINLTRITGLNAKDLASDRDLELAQLAATTAQSGVDQDRALLRAARSEVSVAENDISKIRQKNQAEIEKARGELQKLKAELGKIDKSTTEADTKISQQEQQRIRAPRDGRILAISARQGSDFVKAGDPLAVLVPDTKARAVEIWVDGNDAPLITEGRSVRLQFEGWPAVQFVGWPSVAVGTFGGLVSFVDPAARADGKFRVVVVPDPEDEEWPEANYLRQGVRARGWVLLNRVTVAFEIWRQLNGFPPAQDNAPKEVKKGQLKKFGVIK